MILGIDASRSVSDQRTGTEAYAYFLIREIIAQAAERDHLLRLYFNQAPAPDLFPPATHVEQVVIPRPRLWTHTRLRQELKDRPPDVFFTPAHVVPLACPCPSVATVHDLGYEFFPEAHPRRQLAYLRWSTRHNTRSARRVIVDSKATGADLIRLYKADPARIDVIYPGLDPEITRSEDRSQIDNALNKYGIRSPYLLYLGTLQPRKNLIRLMEAFALSAVSERGVFLVLAGKPGWLARPILEAIDRLPSAIRAKVHLTGYIGETEKNMVLSGATAMVFPSLYEGFGFPVLEAQACGTPVVCSNTSSLPEVAREGAILVDPRNVNALAEAINKVVVDDKIRARLITTGYANISRFSWESAAVQVMNVLEKAVITASHLP